jgi:hypothetical protein
MIRTLLLPSIRTAGCRASLRIALVRCVAAVAVVAGLGAPVAVHAAWVPVDATETSYDYLDPASIRVEGSLRRVWTLHDLAQADADGDRSYRSLLEFHCPEARYRNLQTLFHAGSMGTGRLTGRTAQPGAWRRVQAGSVAATVMQRACQRQ